MRELIITNKHSNLLDKEMTIRIFITKSISRIKEIFSCFIHA